MAEQQSFLSSWQERLTALRNTPPVLKIVWQSGPGVVVFGLVARLFAALLPLALLWIPKLIVDEIVHPKFAAHVMSPRLWWLVASEFGLAVLGGVLARAIDYSDSLLADKYTRHVSIQVMKHAAELDLIAYEDPVFYDRLERARVQATDRLGMIQQIGRLIQLVITTIDSVGHDHCLLAVVDADADCGSASRIPGREPFCFSGIRQEFSPDSGAAPVGLSAAGGGQQGSREGTQVIRTQPVSHPALHQTLRRNLRRERRPVTAEADCRSFPFRDRLRGLLLGLCVRNLADGHGRVQHRTVVPAVGRDFAGQQQHPADFLHCFRHRRPGPLPDRPAGVLRYAADDPVQAECPARSAADCPRI